MKNIHDFFERAAAFEAGIAPIENPKHDFDRILSAIPEEDRVRAKRKFRKLWRKMARKTRRDGDIPRRVGQERMPPTKSQKNARKELVKANLQKLARAKVREALGDGNA